MKHDHLKSIHSPAIGQRITALHYDSGYVVVELESGEEMWVSADWEGYQVFAAGDPSRRGKRRGTI